MDVEAAITLLSYDRRPGRGIRFIETPGPGTRAETRPDVADFEARVTTSSRAAVLNWSFPVPSILLVVAGSGGRASCARRPVAAAEAPVALVPGRLSRHGGHAHLAVSVPSSNRVLRRGAGTHGARVVAARERTRERHADLQSSGCYGCFVVAVLAMIRRVACDLPVGALTCGFRRFCFKSGGAGRLCARAA